VRGEGQPDPSSQLSSLVFLPPPLKNHLSYEQKSDGGGPDSREGVSGGGKGGWRTEGGAVAARRWKRLWARPPSSASTDPTDGCRLASPSSTTFGREVGPGYQDRGLATGSRDGRWEVVCHPPPLHSEKGKTKTHFRKANDTLPSGGGRVEQQLAKKIAGSVCQRPHLLVYWLSR